MNGLNGTPTSANAFATSQSSCNTSRSYSRKNSFNRRFLVGFYDSSDELSQASPGFTRPGTGFTGNTVASSDSPAELEFPDERRPSVASVATASSVGSKSSVNRERLHKKLHHFFGEDPNAVS